MRRILILAFLVGAVHSTEVEAQTFSVAEGGPDSCPKGTENVTFNEVQWSRRDACNTVGHYNQVNLADGAIMFGRYQGCRIYPTGGGEEDLTLCVKPDVVCSATPTATEQPNGRGLSSYVMLNAAGTGCNTFSSSDSGARPPIEGNLVALGGATEKALANNPAFWIQPYVAYEGNWTKFGINGSPVGTLTAACEGDGCRPWPRGDYVLCEPSRGACKVTAVFSYGQAKTGTMRFTVEAGTYTFSDISFDVR